MAARVREGPRREGGEPLVRHQHAVAVPADLHPEGLLVAEIVVERKAERREEAAGALEVRDREIDEDVHGRFLKSLGVQGGGGEAGRSFPRRHSGMSRRACKIRQISITACPSR